VFVAIGAGISAVYYLPMAELARQSVRPEGGLSYAKAVAYALPLPHLVTAVSPFFFFDASTGAYQGAWNPEELALYAGLPTLVWPGSRWSRPRDPLADSSPPRPDRLLFAPATPRRSRLLHSLPVVRGFRAPARTCCSWTPPSPCSRRWVSTHSRTRRARP
jgi:hypothetical protein